MTVDLEENIYKKKSVPSFLLTKFGPGQMANLVYPLYTGSTTEGGAIAISVN